MFRPFLFDLLLYVCNCVVARIPAFWLRRAFYSRVMKFELGDQCFIMMGARFDRTGGLSIGQRSVINRGCHLDNRGGISIGSDVLISPEVMLITADHDMHSTDCRGRTRPVVIGDHVFIGSRATVLPGVSIGKGAVVCAAALVTKDVAPYEVVGGVPAKQIAHRRTDLDYTTTYFRYLM